MKDSARKQQLILEYSHEPKKLSKIRSKLLTPSGCFVNGRLPATLEAMNYFSNSFERILIAALPEDLSSVPIDELTALGGWCAVRTKCLENMRQGFLVDIKSGKKNSIKSIKQVCEWLKNAVSLDQIVDAVGLFDGSNYVLISEETLWTTKIVEILEVLFDRPLSSSEKKQILESIKVAENERYFLTKKYIEKIKAGNVNFVRFYDTEILSDLKAVRDDLLRKLGIGIEDLIKPFLKNRYKKKTVIEKKMKQDLLKYIDTYSLVWMMYTGEYLKILKKKNIVKTKYAVIIEPWSHFRSNEAQMKFNSLIFSNRRNSYFNRLGINSELLAVAISEVGEYNFKLARTTKDLNEIPNKSNYVKIIEGLNKDVSISNLNLSDNKAFIFLANYFSYINSDTLLQCIIISNEYRNKKLKSKFQEKTKSNIDLKRTELLELKEEYGYKLSNVLRSSLSHAQLALSDIFN